MDAQAVAQRCFSNLNRLEWTNNPFTLSQLTESLELPQIVKVNRSMQDNIRQNDFVLLHSVYDRYVLLGNKMENGYQSDSWYVIPDWYTAKCKVTDPNPRIQKQFWNFQGASELSRFSLPRLINFLVETPMYQKSMAAGGRIEWKKVCLKRNTKLIVTELKDFTSNPNIQSHCYLLKDKQGNDYILPSDFNIKFSVEIQQNEYSQSYFDHNSLFSLVEIVTRYELPLIVEFKQDTELNTQVKIPTAPVRLVACSIAKSVVGVFLNNQMRQHSFIELSPATAIDVSISQCLQKGLGNPNASLSSKEREDYNLYTETRDSLLKIYNKACETYKFDLHRASSEERNGLMKIFEDGKNFKSNQAYSLSQNVLINTRSDESKNPDIKIPFLNLKNVFLRPNVDEGDPYDENVQESATESNSISHDMQILECMPEKLFT